MGGIDHQPTTKASQQLTVPMELALSLGGVNLFAGNANIEMVVMAEAGLSYGAARAQLGAATTEFAGFIDQLGVFTGYGKQMLGILGVGDYEPFAPATTLDLSGFYGQLVATGMVPDTAAARAVLEVLRTNGYEGAFRSYVEQADALIDQAGVLCDLTVEMRDGAPGLQGIFWETVEANRMPWRQAFAQVLTGYVNLLAAFQTSALVSTETYLCGTGAPGLMTNVGEVTVATRGSAITAG